MNHFCHIPNPRKIGHTEFEIGLTEIELPTFCNHFTSYRNDRVCTFGLTGSGMFLFFLKSVQPSFLSRSHRKTPTFISDTLSVPPRWYFRSHRKSQRSLYLNFRSDRVFTSVAPRLVKCVCNGWILCGGYIYPSTPSSFERRAIRKYHHFYHTLSEK